MGISSFMTVAASDTQATFRQIGRATMELSGFMPTHSSEKQTASSMVGMRVVPLGKRNELKVFGNNPSQEPEPESLPLEDELYSGEESEEVSRAGSENSQTPDAAESDLEEEKKSSEKPLIEEFEDLFSEEESEVSQESPMPVQKMEPDNEMDGEDMPPALDEKAMGRIFAAVMPIIAPPKPLPSLEKEKAEEEISGEKEPEEPPREVPLAPQKAPVTVLAPKDLSIDAILGPRPSSENTEKALTVCLSVQMLICLFVLTIYGKPPTTQEILSGADATPHAIGGLVAILALLGAFCYSFKDRA